MRRRDVDDFIFENKIIQFFVNVLLSLDQFLNVILLGDPDETISGRLGRAYKCGKPRFFVKPVMKLINYIFFVLFKQKNHCVESIEFEEGFRKELWSWSK